MKTGLIKTFDLTRMKNAFLQKQEKHKMVDLYVHFPTMKICLSARSDTVIKVMNMHSFLNLAKYTAYTVFYTRLIVKNALKIGNVFKKTVL